jgi:hypothetical protein
LYDQKGHRKYLTGRERAAFLRAVEDAPREVYPGGRRSEARALTGVKTTSIHAAAGAGEDKIAERMRAHG